PGAPPQGTGREPSGHDYVPEQLRLRIAFAGPLEGGRAAVKGGPGAPPQGTGGRPPEHDYVPEQLRQRAGIAGPREGARAALQRSWAEGRGLVESWTQPPIDAK